MGRIYERVDGCHSPTREATSNLVSAGKPHTAGKLSLMRCADTTRYPVVGGVQYLHSKVVGLEAFIPAGERVEAVGGTAWRQSWRHAEPLVYL